VYDAPFVGVVSASLARQVFPNTDPLGQRIQLGSTATGGHHSGCGERCADNAIHPPGPEIYMPLRQHPYFGNEVQLPSGPACRRFVSAAVRQKVQALLPETARSHHHGRHAADSVATPHFRTLLLVVFAALALLLAMAGVYGVMLTSRPNGPPNWVRLALGATPRSSADATQGAMLGRGTGHRPGASMLLGRVLAGMLFGLQATDGLTYGPCWLRSITRWPPPRTRLAGWPDQSRGAMREE